MELLTLYFFDCVRTFYAWSFPLNVMVTASMLICFAVGVFPRQRSWVRRIFSVICVCILAAAEVLSHLLPSSEALMMIPLCGWFAEAALLFCAVGTGARWLCRRLRT